MKRTRHGLTLESHGPGFWRTLDGRFEIRYEEEYTTYCDEAHPVNMGRKFRLAVTTMIHQQGYVAAERRFGPATAWAVHCDKKGYLCPGGEEHTYGMWAAWPSDGGDPIYDARHEKMDDAWADLAKYVSEHRS